MMTEIPFYWLDVFTQEPFGGGPTVVYIVEEDLEDSVFSNIGNYQSNFW